MVANELLHNENIPRMVYEAYEVVLAEMGILASKAEQNYISALLTVTELMHLSIETPTPPTPVLCGAMWGIFMVFEGMVSPWGWGISQDLLSIFIHELFYAVYL